MKTIDVIDVSKWQGKIDWYKVNNTVQEVYIKATEGIGFIDPSCKENASAAAEAGLKIGYYHFASLNDKEEIQDAKLEAQYFVKILKTLPTPSLPVVLDIEENKAKLTPDEVLNWIRAFFMELEALGFHDYMLYSYTPFLNTNLPKNHGFGGVKLWLAAYTETPKLPSGWPGYYLWQYSSEGKIEGIKGNVDLNTYN